MTTTARQQGVQTGTVQTERRESDRAQPLAGNYAALTPVKHLIMFSGGACSYCAAKRVIERHGQDGVVLLFADTLIEDDDLYRFVREAAASLAVPLITVADGRTPWDVMRKERMIGNSRMDPCSKILKRELLNKWRDVLCTPEESTVYFGIDWTENRIETIRARQAPFHCEAPMCDPPYLSKPEMIAACLLDGIQPPRLYGMGFAHNNCGGFCIKAGQASFAKLLKYFPDRYLEHERQEEELRAVVGDHSIMKDRRGGESKPLTMREFRRRIECGEAHDKFDFGGCGCATA